MSPSGLALWPSWRFSARKKPTRHSSDNEGAAGDTSTHRAFPSPPPDRGEDLRRKLQSPPQDASEPTRGHQAGPKTAKELALWLGIKAEMLGRFALDPL